jgi:hypothetical protein
MKKLTYLIAGMLTVATISSSAVTISSTLAIGTMTNLLSVYNGSAKVIQIAVTASTSTNAAVMLYDCPSNILTYINPAYTNTISYGTNYISSWTNFYGVVQSWTNTALYDVTNNLVLSTTNSYPARLSAATLANTTTYYNNQNYYFNQGVWATNTGPGVVTVTLTYQQ